VGERDALVLARRGVDEGHAQAVGDVRTLARRGRAPLLAEAAAHAARSPRAPHAAAEQSFEDVAQVDALVGKSLEVLRTETALAAARAAGKSAAAHAGEGIGRIAVRVDLAAVEAGALVLVAQQVVGLRHLREALGRLR